MNSDLPPPFNAYRGNDPFLFVSYAHEDKGLVYPVIKDLNKKRVRIWYDEGIPASSNWIESIADKILNCNCFLVFITPEALKSQVVCDEINYAKRKGCLLYILKIPSFPEN
ncbi:MAG: toll/interleukin-1 receptor domain-containing protein [Promethearchaeota archaeon]